ncbi:hypothetical protein FGE12_08640 [Aggregicoccus sp. 17bor-14]|uniref:hypothetical protein n=1 Tax=Myxococcaceae TaxID=31 RepID=UPI00129CCC93|nr:MULTISPECIES: hypothetical protein [Myxococcaceae]MBF5042466.1 hypothetical protein [Simulacricoccus sp. 17bor-14]MRI88237.1 hypothetical protein [Aggregicoccus sp. 17bor-14]
MATSSSGLLPSILVVDHRSEVQQALCLALTAHGYEVHTAVDLGEALERMEGLALPRLVVHDVRLLQPADDELVPRLHRNEALGTLAAILGSESSAQESEESLSMRHPLRLSELLALAQRSSRGLLAPWRETDGARA